MGYSELRELEAEYLELLSELYSEVQVYYPEVEITSLGGLILIFFDIDGTFHARHSLSCSKNFFNAILEENQYIDKLIVKNAIEEIERNPHDIKEPYGRILGEFKDKLTIYQSRKASLKAARRTIPVAGCQYGISRLERNNCLSVLLSAGERMPVNAFSEIKVGISSFVNCASKFIYDPKTGFFTGNTFSLLDENRAMSVKERQEQYSVIPSMSMIVDDSLLHRSVARASRDGVCICVSDDEKMGQLKSNLYRSNGQNGPIFVYKPEFRDNFGLIVDEILKMRRVRTVWSVISPPQLSKALDKIDSLRNQGKRLYDSNEIEFLMDYDDFINPLAEISKVKELQFRVGEFDREIHRIRDPSDLSDKKDAVVSMVRNLNKHLIEYGVNEEFKKRLHDIAYRWESLHMGSTAL